MRASNKVAMLAVAAMLGLAYIGVVQSKPKKGQIVTVRVLRAKVMKKPKFIGGVAGSVSRGQQLTFKKAKGDWYQVSGRVSGWVHRTNVVDKRVKLSSKPGGGGSASRDEVELAGRGFTPQVEGEYRRKNPNFDFSHVDAIEKLEVPDAEVEKFMQEGGLVIGGGK